MNGHGTAQASNGGPPTSGGYPQIYPASSPLYSQAPPAGIDQQGCQLSDQLPAATYQATPSADPSQLRQTSSMNATMQTAPSNPQSEGTHIPWRPSMGSMPPSMIAVLPSQADLAPRPTDLPPGPAPPTLAGEAPMGPPLPRTDAVPHLDTDRPPSPPPKHKGCCSCFGGSRMKNDIEALHLGRARRAVSEALSALKWSVRFHGPWLRFGGYDPTTRKWTGSVMLMVNQAKSPLPPTLYYQDEGGHDDKVTVRLRNIQGGIKAITTRLKKLEPRRVDTFREWTFWRFDLELVCGARQRKIRYFPYVPTEVAMIHRPHRHYTFMLPGAQETWRWGFHSCNGFCEAADAKKSGGIQPMWKDVIHAHNQKNLHVLIGGGDQLYNDGVWEVPSLVAWCKMSNAKERVAHPFTQEMSTEVTLFYFKAYVTQWSEDVFDDALASIPQLMVWDDHDIFDGWGSYPDDLQKCPVFQGVYSIARRFYAAFQLHTNVENAKTDNNYFGEDGWNLLTCLGSTTAVLMTDSRTERTAHQCMHPNSYEMIKAKLYELPDTVRHVIVVATVPLVYPKIPGLEAALSMMQGDTAGAFSLAQLLTKTGLAKTLTSQFGTIEILDDLMDHWGADVHTKEKEDFVHLMQAVAQDKSWRFTLISGDVHVAALGTLASKEAMEPRHDYRYMPQIISSAIANVPPPPGVVNALTKCASVGSLDKDTKEYMVDLFGPKTILMNSRNWLVAQENVTHPNDTSEANGAISYQYRVEPLHKHLTLHPVTYEVAIPRLELPRMNVRLDPEPGVTFIQPQ